MSDYTELIKALRFAWEQPCYSCTLGQKCNWGDFCFFKRAADAIEELLAKDTNVPNKIVHCGECRFWDSPPSCEGLAKCVTGESGIRYRSKIDYCSKGMPLPAPPKAVKAQKEARDDA